MIEAEARSASLAFRYLMPTVKAWFLFVAWGSSALHCMALYPLREHQKPR